MQTRLNKFERVAGTFVLLAILGGLVSTVTIAINKGWFESKVSFTTHLDTAEGLYAGTPVLMSGLHVGKVTDVILEEDNTILVEFDVMERFAKRLKVDSQVMIVRPFIIGDKVVDLTVGTPGSEIIKAGSTIAAIPTTDLMDLLSGRRLGPVLSDLTKLVENFKVLAKAFADRKRIDSLVKVFDRLEPLVNNLNDMSIGVNKLAHTVNKKKRLEIIISNLTELTNEMSVVLPEFKKHVPNMGQQMGQLVENLNVLTGEFKKLTPAITAVAPDLPRVSVRAVEALDEAVVTMKALQKSFMLRGSVEDVREEESQRMPAGEK